MSTLEMKGEIFELVSAVRSENELEKLLQIIREFVSQKISATQKSDDDSDMTPAQVMDLHRAIERSRDERNLISNEEALKRLSKWLN